MLQLLGDMTTGRAGLQAPEEGGTWVRPTAPQQDREVEPKQRMVVPLSWQPRSNAQLLKQLEVKEQSVCGGEWGQ